MFQGVLYANVCSVVTVMKVLLCHQAFTIQHNGGTASLMRDRQAVCGTQHTVAVQAECAGGDRQQQYHENTKLLRAKQR